MTEKIAAGKTGTEKVTQKYKRPDGSTVIVPAKTLISPIAIDYLLRNEYGHVMGHIADSDVEAFRLIIERMPQHFKMVELGSLHGASAVTFALLTAEMGKTCDILCIDSIFIFPKYLQIFMSNTADFPNITCRAEVFSSSFTFNDGPIDLYFDDASHQEIATYKQLVYWSQYAKNIVVHDYNKEWEGNVAAVDRFAAERGSVIEHFMGSSVIFMKENT